MEVVYFLLDYWWVVILAIILLIILAVLKIVTRVMILIVILAALGFGIWHLFFASGMAASYACFPPEAQKVVLLQIDEAALNPGTHRSKYVCEDARDKFYSLVACLEKSRVESPLTFKVYVTYTHTLSVIRQMIIDHNEACPGAPVTKPDFLD